jgi:dihydroflavonol-4-reductase
MRALVLGATGHVGNAVVRELLARGWEVTAVTRRAGTPANLAGLAAGLVRGDADRPGQVREWLRGHDLLVDAAAPYPLHLFCGEDVLPRAAARTEELLATVAERGAKLAYVSSFVTLRSGRSDAGLSRRHPYFAVKERIESQVLAAARGGLPAVVVNPTTCFGPWDLKPRSLCFVPQLLGGEVAALVRHPVNAVDVRDVAIGLVSAVEQERFGEPIPLCGHDVPLDELAARLCAAGGVRPPLWRLPLASSLAASWWTEALFALTGRPSPWPALGLMLVSESQPMKPGLVQRALGAAPRPLDETLRGAIAWYREIGYC